MQDIADQITTLETEIASLNSKNTDLLNDASYLYNTSRFSQLGGTNGEAGWIDSNGKYWNDGQAQAEHAAAEVYDQGIAGKIAANNASIANYQIQINALTNSSAGIASATADATTAAVQAKADATVSTTKYITYGAIIVGLIVAFIIWDKYKNKRKSVSAA